MSTADTKSSSSEHVIEQRLDALDRALLGLLPRSERLAMVAQVESRVRELTSSDPDAQSISATAAETDVVAGAVSRRASTAGPKRRSRLALSSGILGITALTMLFAMPITYLFVMTIGEELGEMVSISLLSIHVLAVAVGGLVALVMGISGLVSLARRKGQMVGHGWAITGLCTAPLPMVIGGMMVLVTGLSLFAVQSISVQSGTPVNVVSSSSSYYPSPATCGPPVAANCAPASATPSGLPVPLCAAPTFCAPGNDCPPSLPPSTRELAPTGYAAPDEFQKVPAQPAPRRPGAPTAQLPQAAPAPTIAPPSSGVPAPLRAEPSPDAPAPSNAAPPSSLR
jgi:hypothetical protein